MTQLESKPKTFQLLETTLGDIQEALASGAITARELVELYLKRIEAYDRGENGINCVITLNPTALEEADAADAHMKASGPIGPLHGVPIVLKDQMDAKGMPTTLGSVIFKDYYPERDSTCDREAQGRRRDHPREGDAGRAGRRRHPRHAVRFHPQPLRLERTVGGSSGGSAAAVTANLERRRHRPGRLRVDPAAVRLERHRGHAPDAGAGQSRRCLGRLAESLRLAGPDDAHRHRPREAARCHGGLRRRGPADGARRRLRARDVHGLARQGRAARARASASSATRWASGSEPDSEDFAKITAVFDRAVGELAAAGATLVDPIEIPNLNELLAKRTGDGSDAAFKQWAGRGGNFPFASQAEMQAAADAANAKPGRPTSANMRAFDPMAYHEYLVAREELMTNVLKVMADHKLDAIVHKTVEHQPTLISEGINPPYKSSTARRT